MTAQTNTEAETKRGFGTVVKEYWGYAANGTKYFFKNESQMWISFLLPALILLCAYFIFGVWPVGEKSVLALDLNGQYVFYYDHMYDVLYGDSSLFYSWSRNLSGEWMGIIGYYLGSPFNLIVWLFPRTMITEGLLVMMCVKVGAIGLCTSIYLSRAKDLKKLTCVIFSICYALCSYTIVQTMNPMWLDGVMILPIICLALERFIDYGKFRLLVISWVYAFVTCFYIGFMLAIFSVIYFFAYMVITKRSEAREKFFIKLLQCLGLGVTAVMISCYMIIPVYESLSYGKFSFSDPDYTLVSNFNFIELFDKLLPNSYDTVRMTGLPFLYCGTVTVLLLPAFFFHKKIRANERITYGVVMLLLIVCMYIRPVDMLWHGGQMPNWLPYRYSFIVSFLMVVCAAQAFDRLKKSTSTKAVGITCVVWLGIMVYQESMDNYVEDLNNGRDTLNNFSTILPAMAIAITVAICLVRFRKDFNYKFTRKKTMAISVVMIAVISGEALYSTTAQISTQNTDIVYSNRATYLDYVPKLRDVVNEIKENDDGFYRIEKLFFRNVNDPLAADMYGLSHSSSTLNAKPIDLLKRLGFTAKSHYTRYSGATLITSSIFGVKYELSTGTNSVTNIRDGTEEITVTENEYALPINYLADKSVEDLELTEYDPFAAQTELLNALIGKEYSYYERITDYDFSPVNVTEGTTTDGHHSFKIVTSGDEASLTFEFVTPKSGDLYMFLPSVYERECEVFVNGVSKGKYFEGDNSYMRNFGYYDEGSFVTVKLVMKKDNLYYKEAQFAIMDEEQVKTALTELKEMNAETECYLESETHVVMNVNASENQTLFTTIPSENGWKVYIDGKEAEYTETVDALICIPITAGEHTVEMKFTTAGYPMAVIISIAGLIIFIGIIILWIKKNPADRKRRKDHVMYICSGAAAEKLDAKRRAERKIYEKKHAKKLSGDDKDDSGDDEEDEILFETTIEGAGKYFAANGEEIDETDDIDEGEDEEK